MLYKINLILPVVLLTLWCFTYIITIAAADQQADEMASMVQDMLNYLNDHPLSATDKSSAQAIQDILHQVEMAASSAATNIKPASVSVSPSSNNAPAAAPASPNSNNGGHADIDLSNNVNNAPADIPIALAAGVPASVAAAAAMPPNMARPANVANPVQAAAIVPAPAAQVAPVPAAVNPPAPTPAEVPADTQDNGISIAAGPTEPNIVNPHVIGNAAITPVTTLYPSGTSVAATVEPSVTVILPPPVTGSLSTSTGSVGATPTPVTTATVSNSTIHSMNATSTSTGTTTRSSSSNAPSSTTTIPPISSGNSVYDRNEGFALVVSILGLVSLFYHI